MKWIGLPIEGDPERSLWTAPRMRDPPLPSPPLAVPSDVLFYVTIGCMLAQHDLELKQRGFPNEGPKAEQMT